ncbi:MAG: hypothetical protein B9S32_17805 [Verrucomicrobia bacterium Tous-C9LFEB]|nr:MAG: hypothetical protein B9S32_17805 [Verrucomicrobia bacterium Tous-C9LFEB]
MSSANTVPVLNKTIALIEHVAASEHGRTIKNLSLSLNIPAATCYRIVRTLAQHRWLQEDGEGTYRIAFGLAHAARSYAEMEHQLAQLEQPLKQLCLATGLSTKITLREGHHAVTVMRAEPPQLNAITSPVGSSFHLAIGSAASVLLSPLNDEEIKQILRTAPKDCWQRQSEKDVFQRIKDVRTDGLCRELGQYHASIYAVSVPVPVTKTMLVALTVVGWPDDFKGPRQKEIEKQLRPSVAIFKKRLAQTA